MLRATLNREGSVRKEMYDQGVKVGRGQEREEIEADADLKYRESYRKAQLEMMSAAAYFTKGAVGFLEGISRMQLAWFGEGGGEAMVIAARRSNHQDLSCAELKAGQRR